MSSAEVHGARRRRRLRRLGWASLAVIVLLAALAPLVLPLIVEAGLDRVADRLGARYGVGVRWATSDLRADGLTLTDVQLTFDAGRARVARIDVDVSLWPALFGEVRVSAVRADGPRVWLGALSESDGISDAMPSGMPSDMPSDAIWHRPFRMPSALADGLRRLADGPRPVIHLTDAGLTVRRGGLTLSAGAGAVELAPDAGGWTLSGRAGEARLLDHALDGLAFEGRITPTSISLGAGLPPETRVALGDGAVLAVEAARLAVGPDGLELRVEGVSGALSGVEVEGATATARWADDIRLTLGDGRVRVDDRWMARLRAGGPQGDAPAGERAGPGLDPWRIPPTVRLAAEGLTIELPGLPPLLEARAGWHHGRLDARAVLAGGEVTLAADFTPGRLRPDGARATIRGVRLAPLFARRLPPAPPRRPRSPARADGVLDASLSVVATDDMHPIGEGPLRVDGRGRWREGRVELAGLSADPIDGVDLSVEGHAVWHPGDDLLAFAGRLAQGPPAGRPLAVVGAGQIHDAVGDPRVVFELRGEPIDCAAAFAALPAGLWGPYDRAALSGELAPTVRLDWPVHRPQTLELKIRGLFEACAVHTLAARSGPPATVEGRPAAGLDDVGWLDARFVLPVTEGVSEGAEVRVGPGVPGYVPLEQLPRYVGATMYQSEEMNFWRNNAIDRGLLMRALRIDLEHGRFVYGGSTVTQQLVKNLFLTREKTLARKLQELLVATRITQTISRERVLELYLNCIEFGPDVYGIGPAARYYFQKDARELTPREAVFLAMLKPAPGRGAYYRRRGHGPTHGWWVERAEVLMGRLVEGGQISAATAEAERPYQIEWIDRRYVPGGSRPPSEDGPPDPPLDASPAPPPTPPGGRRLPIDP